MDKKIKVVDLWIAQKEVDKMKEKLEEAQKQLQSLVKASTTEELILFMDSFYEAEMKNSVTEIPELFVYANNELVDREDSELIMLEKEEAPK